jgi:putative transposase
MARTQRIEYEGAVYHGTARGNERRQIVRDGADREHFLRVLGESVVRFEVRLYLFCLIGLFQCLTPAPLRGIRDCQPVHVR